MHPITLPVGHLCHHGNKPHQKGNFQPWPSIAPTSATVPNPQGSGGAHGIKRMVGNLSLPGFVPG